MAEVKGPLYLQVAGTLRTAIVRGIYPVGSRVPTEEELCQRFGVSRHTVREALRRLRDEGLIGSRQGGRPVVVSPASQGVMRRFYAEMGKEVFDHTIGSQLVVQSMELVRSDAESIAGIDLPAGTTWLKVTGYRQAGHPQAIVCWNEYLIQERFATVSKLLPRYSGPIVALIEDLFDEKVVTVTQLIAAVPLPADQAAAFGSTPGAPALRIVTRCDTSGGETALHGVAIHPGGPVAHSIVLQEEG